MTPHILLVEDDPAIAHTLSYALKKHQWQVTWADCIHTALDRLAALPQLSAIVMDIGLPDGSGLTLCQQIRFSDESAIAKHKQVPILFLSAKDEETDKLLGLQIGADDYITKPFSTKEVIARIEVIWRRQTMENHKPKTTTAMSAVDSFTKVLPTGTWHYDAGSYQLSLNSTALTLSKTELAIMQTLLANPKQVFSREQLLHAVSTHPEHRLARTVDAHIKSLRQKFATITDISIISTHRGLGYSLAFEL